MGPEFWSFKINNKKKYENVKMHFYRFFIHEKTWNFKMRVPQTFDTDIFDFLITPTG